MKRREQKSELVNHKTVPEDKSGHSAKPIYHLSRLKGSISKTFKDFRPAGRHSCKHIHVKCAADNFLESELIQEHKIPHPELAVESFIMSHHEVAKISESLPARAQCRTWNLVYSTTVHGFSLATLYKCMLAHNHSPTLLVIKDSHDKVFGAFTSSHLHISHNFYGTGESFLFSFTPEYQKYKWTAVDHHIVKGDVTSLSIGISGGAHGLWLDGDLYRGRSERCRTFDNQPLASEVDFIVSSLEAWSFE